MVSSTMRPLRWSLDQNSEGTQLSLWEIRLVSEYGVHNIPSIACIGCEARDFWWILKQLSAVPSSNSRLLLWSLNTRGLRSILGITDVTTEGLKTFYNKYKPHLPSRSRRLEDARPMAYLTDTLSGMGRLFVVGNYVLQQLLRPLHDWIMECLARAMDGTFCQTAPLDRLAGSLLFNWSEVSHRHISCDG